VDYTKVDLRRGRLELAATRSGRQAPANAAEMPRPRRRGKHAAAVRHQVHISREAAQE
jgi:hypothetical protein